MEFLNKLRGKDQENSLDHVRLEGPFAAKIIFECGRVLQNEKKTVAAVEEFIAKFPDRIAETPKITQASDGNVIELTLFCESKEDVLQFNRELEIIAHRYGLRE